MSEKTRTFEDDDNDLDIRIIEAFIRLEDEDKRSVIEHIKAMLSKMDEAEN